MANLPKRTKKSLQEASEKIQRDTDNGCSLQQITMFDCDQEMMETKGITKCYPVPRVFRVCKDRPAIEVTALLRYKDDNGDPYLSKDYLCRLPKGEPWN